MAGERRKSRKINTEKNILEEYSCILAGGSEGQRERTVLWRWYCLHEPGSRGRPPECHHVQYARGDAQERPKSRATIGNDVLRTSTAMANCAI